MDTKSVEPTLYDEIIFENNEYFIKKLSFWPDCSLQDRNIFGFLLVVLPDGRSFHVTRDGRRIVDEKEIVALGLPDELLPKQIDCSDGMFLVSDLASGGIEESAELPYSSYDATPGIWGYVDSAGKEIIKPQYIYAYGFENGIAEVCKGKWTKKYNTGKYRAEEALWGMIDKTGKEVVPCKFEEIRHFLCYDSISISAKEDDRYLKACYPHEKWGIINFRGEWVIEPMFAKLDHYISSDGCFAFYATDELPCDDVSKGIYSIREHRVLFDPHFTDVNLIDDGIYQVVLYDEKLRRNIEQTIDRAGNIIFVNPAEQISINNDIIIAQNNDGSTLYNIIRKSSFKGDSCWMI